MALLLTSWEKIDNKPARGMEVIEPNLENINNVNTSILRVVIREFIAIPIWPIGSAINFYYRLDIEISFYKQRKFAIHTFMFS